MKSFTVYIDESLSTRDMVRLKHEIMAMPHVVDVEHPRHDQHDLTVDYEPHAGLTREVLRMLRAQGLHPDIISA